MKDLYLIFACLAFPNRHVLFCNNKKNKLFKTQIKTVRFWANTICFCLNSTYPFMRGRGQAPLAEDWGQGVGALRGDSRGHPAYRAGRAMGLIRNYSQITR